MRTGSMLDVTGHGQVAHVCLLKCVHSAKPLPFANASSVQTPTIAHMYALCGQ
jgi:hypothetical protein